MKRYGVIKVIGTLCVSVLVSFHCSAQSTDNSNRSSCPGSFSIKSTKDYRTAQDSIEGLAYELYTIYQQYPTYSYEHQFDVRGNLIGVTVTGIHDAEMANRAAAYLMQIEVLGEAIRNMDHIYLPESVMPKNFGRLTKKQTLGYVPVPKGKRRLNPEQQAIL